MTPWQKRATGLIRRMAEDMQLRNFSPKTIDAYTYHVGRFAEFLGSSPEHATPEDVRSFQLHLINERKVGWSSFNQAVCGLRRARPAAGSSYRSGKFATDSFRTESCSRSWAVSMVPFGRKPKTLPAVLSGEEVTRLLSWVKSLKHRTFLLTLYAAGLRLSEAAALTIADIDSQRMQLRIASGKGAKERLVPLSPRLLEALRHYWKEVRSPKYLFPGKTFDVPLSPTTIQNTCKAAVQKAGIDLPPCRRCKVHWRSCRR